MVLCIFYVSEINKFDIVILATALCTGKHNMKSINGGHYSMWHCKTGRRRVESDL